MADKGIFIKVMAELQLASFAAALTKMKGMASGAAKDIDRSWEQANASLKNAQRSMITAENEMTTAAERRAAAEAKAEQASLRRVGAVRQLSDEQKAAVDAYLAAQAKVEDIDREIAANRMAQISAEGKALDELIVKQKALRDARVEAATGADASAVALNQNGRRAVGAYANEANAAAILASRHSAAADAVDNHTDAVNEHADAQDRLANSASNSARAFNVVGGVSTAVTAGILGEGTKIAAQVQENMNRLVALRQETSASIGGMTQQIYQLASAVPFTVQDLSKGLQQIEQHGYRGQDALNALTVSAKLAVATHGQLGDTVGGLTTQLDDMGYQTKTGTELLGDMNTMASQLVDSMTSLKNLDPSQYFLALHSFEPSLKAYASGVPGNALAAQGAAMMDALSQTGMSQEQSGANLGRFISVLGGMRPGSSAFKLIGQLGGRPEEIAKQMQDQGPVAVIQSIQDLINKHTDQNGMVDIGWRFNNDQVKANIDQIMGGLDDQGQKFLKDHPEIEKGTAKQFTVKGLLSKSDVSDTESQDILTLAQWEAMSKAPQDYIKRGGTAAVTQGQAYQLLFGTGDVARTGLILGQAIADVLKKSQSIEQAGHGNSLQDAFDQQMNAIGPQWKQLGASAGALAGRIANDLLPVMSGVVKGFTAVLDFLSKHKVIADTLLAGMGAVATAWVGAKIINGLKTMYDAFAFAGTTLKTGASAVVTRIKGAGDTLATAAETGATEVEEGSATYQAEADAAGAKLDAGAGVSPIGAVGRDAAAVGEDGAALGWGSRALRWGSRATRILGPLAVAAPLAIDLATPNPDAKGPSNPAYHQDRSDGGQFAGGGVLPGYSPGKDNLLGMVNGRPVGLSGGEGILVPEAVRAIGPGNVLALNRHFSGGRKPGGGGYASGGIMDAFQGLFKNILISQFGGIPSEMMSSSSGGYSMMPTAHMMGSAGGIKGIAQQLMARMGWGPGEWSSLDALISKESGWNPGARNPSSGAFGLGQFLGSTAASYPGSLSSDPVSQLMAALQYIKNRYGSPSAAWAFHRAHNWYSGGGIVGFDGGTDDVPYDVNQDAGSGKHVVDPAPDQGGKPGEPSTMLGKDLQNFVGGWKLAGQDVWRWTKDVGGFIGGLWSSISPHAPSGATADPALNTPQGVGQRAKSAPPGRGTFAIPSIAGSVGDIVRSVKGQSSPLNIVDAQGNIITPSDSGGKYYKDWYGDDNASDTSDSSSGGDAGSSSSDSSDGSSGASSGGGSSYGGRSMSPDDSLAGDYGDYSGISDTSGMSGSPMSFSGNAAAVMNFAQQASRLPYVMGGFGPGGFDCSGLAAALANVATTGDWQSGGRFSTANEAQALAARGFQPGPGGLGSLTIGWDGTHTGITLPDGTPIDAQDSKDGIVMGPGSKGASGFPNVMHFDMPGGAPIAGVNFGSGGKGGLGGSRGGASDGTGADYDPFSQFSGGFTMKNVVGTLATFLTELALGNPYGQLQALKSGKGPLSPLDPNLSGVLNNNASAYTNFNREQLKSNEYQLRYQKITGDIANDQRKVDEAKTPKAKESAQHTLDNAKLGLEQFKNKLGLAGVTDEGKLQSELGRLDSARTPNAYNNALNAIGNTNADLAAAGGSPNFGASTSLPPAGGGPGGDGIDLSPGNVGFGGQGFMPSSLGGRSATSQGVQSRGWNSEGKGGAGASFTGGIAGQAASLAASAVPGGGAVAQIGMQEANRFAGYVGQVAGILASAPLETFGLNDTALSDPSKSWFGKLAVGLAGAHPTAPNDAGKTQPPLKPKEDKGGRSGESKGGGIHIENQVFNGHPDGHAHAVNKELNRTLMMNDAAGASRGTG